MKCGDCVWLDRRVGRTGSCRDRGDTEESEACAEFRPRDPDARRQHLSEVLSQDQPFREDLYAILSDEFNLRRALVRTIDTIAQQLGAQGDDAWVDQHGKERFEKLSNIIFDVYVLYRMINAVGIGRYADDIIRAEIQRRFR